jgi:putative restriction endonuclease
MDREAIIQRFEQLKVWRRAGERAPHKVLLVLYAIGKLLRDESQSIPYSEVDENLGQLLREFGPRRTNYQTQYPFWRLQNDEIWEISDADKIGQTSKGDALKSDLIRYDVSGGFLKEIAYKLENDTKLSFEIVQSLLDAHFPSSFHHDILRAVEIESPFQVPQPQRRGSKRRRRNPNFRANILKAYNYRCAVCGYDVTLRGQPVALEASHIRWHQANGPDTQVNGLALCSLHHKLFDRGAFTLSKYREILVSADVDGSVGLDEWLRNFDKHKIHLPQRQSYYPSPKFTTWHVREVFKGDYREL